MMKLTVLDGPMRGLVASVPENGILIGRDNNCALALPGDSVSRHHARLTCVSGVYYVEDLQSTNGVQVNGATISGRRALMAGDRIRVGEHLLRFVDEQQVLSPEDLARLEAKSLAVSSRQPLSAGAKAGLALLAVAVLGLVLFMLLHSLTPATPVPGRPLSGIPPDSLSPLILIPPDSAPLPSTMPGTNVAVSAAGSHPATPAPPDYYWVRSQPDGALVTLDGQPAGPTPILLRRLKAGNHALRFTLDGYAPLDRPLVMPHLGAPPVYELTMQPGVVMLTSVPDNATVTRGKQFVGHTPLLLQDYAPGTYEFRLVAPGYQETKATVEVLAYRGTTAEVKLENAMGMLDIIAFPPGAKVYVDNQLKGIAQPQDAPELPAQPLHLEGILTGPRTVFIEFEGLRCKDLKVTVAPGVAATVRPLIWLPNVRVTQADGTVLTGMLRDRNLLGDLTLAISLTQDIAIPANKVKDVKSRPFLDVVKTGPKWPAQ